MTVPARPTDVARGSRDVQALARGGALNLVGAVVKGVVGFAIILLVTNGLGSAERAGRFVTALAVATILARLVQLGANIGVVRWIPAQLLELQRGMLGHLLRVALVPVALIAVAAAAVLYLGADALAGPLASGRGADEVAAYLRTFALFVPVTAAFGVLVMATRAFGTMLPGTVLEGLTVPALQVAAVAVVLVVGLGPAALGIAYWGPMAVGVIGALWYLRRLVAAAEAGVTAPFEAAMAAPLRRAFWRFSLPRAAAGFFAVTIQWLDTILLGLFASSGAAGIYAAATRYALFGTAVQNAVAQSMQPRISGLLAAGEQDRARTVYQTATGWSIALTWPLYLVVGVFAPAWLGVFGADFDAGAPALMVLSGAWMIGVAMGPVDTVLLMGGRSSWHLYNLGAALAVNVGLNVLLIPRLGATGAAIAWTASILTNNLLPLAQVWRSLHMHPFSNGVRRVAVLAATCYGGGGLAVRWWLGTSLPAAIAAAALATVPYLAGLWLLREHLQLSTLGAVVRRRGRAASFSAVS